MRKFFRTRGSTIFTLVITAELLLIIISLVANFLNYNPVVSILTYLAGIIALAITVIIKIAVTDIRNNTPFL